MCPAWRVRRTAHVGHLVTARDDLIVSIGDARVAWFTTKSPGVVSSVFIADALLGAGYVKMPSREALGSVIWHTSRDHGSISATGVNSIADAILALLAGETS